MVLVNNSITQLSTLLLCKQLYYSSTRIIEKLNSKISNEIVNFIEESGHLDKVATKIFDALPELHSPMRIDLARVFEKVEPRSLSKYIKSLPIASLSSKQYFIFSMLEYASHNAVIKYSSIPSTVLTASALCGWYFKGVPKDNFALEMRAILGLTLLLIKPLVDKANIGKDKVRSQIVLQNKDEIVAAKALNYLSIKYTEKNDFESLEFDGNGLFDNLNTELSILEVYAHHDNGSMSLNVIDKLLMDAYRMMDDEIKGNDRRHIEYRRDLVKFFRSNTNSMFVIDKTIKPVITTVKSNNSILTLKRD